MHTRTTAGQATIEYVAAIALVAAILIVAGPAVGAPSIAQAVYGKVKVALCYAGGDVCSTGQAAREGLAPCPLQSDLTGHEASGTAFSIELGGRVTLTVTPRSDGTVGVVRAVGGSVGAAAGSGSGVELGPVRFDWGAEAAARGRVQVARGWEFKDQASADRFLEHAVRHSIDEKRYPAAWHSLEGGPELEASAGVAVGHRHADSRVGLLGGAGSAGSVLGGRLTRDGTVTLYTRASVELETKWPVLPTIGPGRSDFIIEYSFSRAGPRELVLRRAIPSPNGNRITETAMRLDLRDPENLASVRSLLDAPLPWPRNLLAAAAGGLGDRIRAHGTIETTTSEVADTTKGLSAHAEDGVKFGLSYKRIKVHRTLVSATARTGEPFDRRRFDCLPAADQG